MGIGQSTPERDFAERFSIHKDDAVQCYQKISEYGSAIIQHPFTTILLIVIERIAFPGPEFLSRLIESLTALLSNIYMFSVSVAHGIAIIVSIVADCILYIPFFVQHGGVSNHICRLEMSYTLERNSDALSDSEDFND